MTKVDGASPEEASDELAHGLRQSQAAGQVDRFAYERPGQATSRRKRVLSRTHAFGLSRERFHLPPLTCAVIILHSVAMGQKEAGVNLASAGKLRAAVKKKEEVMKVSKVAAPKAAVVISDNMSNYLLNVSVLQPSQCSHGVPQSGAQGIDFQYGFKRRKERAERDAEAGPQRA